MDHGLNPRLYFKKLANGFACSHFSCRFGDSRRPSHSASWILGFPRRACLRSRLALQTKQHPAGSGIDDCRTSNLRSLARARVNMATDDQSWFEANHCVSHGCAAKTLARSRYIDCTFRRRMGHQHSANRTIAKQTLGVSLRKIVTPTAEWCYRYATADSKKRHALNVGSCAMQDARTLPIRACRGQFLERFVIARNKHSRNSNRLQYINAG